MVIQWGVHAIISTDKYGAELVRVTAIAIAMAEKDK